MSELDTAASSCSSTPSLTPSSLIPSPLTTPEISVDHSSAVFPQDVEALYITLRNLLQTEHVTVEQLTTLRNKFDPQLGPSGLEMVLNKDQCAEEELPLVTLLESYAGIFRISGEKCLDILSHILNECKHGVPEGSPTSSPMRILSTSMPAAKTKKPKSSRPHGATYMSEALFTAYFAQACSLGEAVRSIVRDYPTYREVSIYARARRLQLRYDGRGNFTPGPKGLRIYKSLRRLVERNMEFNIDLSDDSSLLDNDDGDGDSLDRTSESLFPSDVEEEKGRSAKLQGNVVGSFQAIQWSRESSQQSASSSVNGLDLLAQSAYMSQCSCPECSPPSHTNENHQYQHVTPSMTINSNILGNSVTVSPQHLEYPSAHSIPATLPSQIPIPGIPLPNYGAQNLRKRKMI